MVTFFTARGYPHDLVERALDRASTLSRTEALTPKPQLDKDDRTLFTLTFHPHNIPVKQILLSNFPILQDDPKLTSLFRRPPLAAYKRDRNLGDLLIRSTFKPSPPHTCPSGNSRCDKSRCKCCPLLNTTTSTFTGPSGRSFTIRGAFTCQTSDVVYIVSCSLCHQLYIGETYRTLGERAREHRDSINQKRNTPVANHFTSQFHNLSHFSVAAIWRNSSGDPLYRKYMEKRVINSLGTTSPQGINLRD